MMGWSTAIEYYAVSSRSVTVPSYESRTDPRTRVEQRHYTINGAVSEDTYPVTVPYEVEQRRIVKTRTDVIVYECRGMDRDTAMAAKSSSTAQDIQTGNSTSTEVDAARSNDADGWTVTKTVTAITITRGAWSDYVGV